jgi:polygalacturonase
MKDRKKVILIPVLALISIFSQAMVYNVRTYGAKGDGKTLDSPAINKAIESASKAGGGPVYFPAGTYCSFSIRLK